MITSTQARFYLCRECLRRVAGHRARLVSTVPFRKQLKDEAKQRRISNGEAKPKRSVARDSANERWELTVGIEIHAQLNTAHKLFSSARVPGCCVVIVSLSSDPVPQEPQHPSMTPQTHT
jgi:hypothetical protein